MKKYLPLFFSLFLILLLFGFACDNNCIVEPEKEPIYENITVHEAYQLIQNNIDNSGFVIIDIRTETEYNSGHIENAINLNYYSSTFREDLDQLDKTKMYLIHCKSGGRSAGAFNTMKELEFMEVYNMPGGINQWISEGYPVVN